MAKANLFGEALWDQYSNKVAERMNNPKNQGEITENQAKAKNGKLIVADFGAESCGDAVRLYWLVDESNDKIIDAKFKSFGCGTAIASSDMMVDLCIGKTVDEAIKITNIDVEMALRDDPDVPAVPGQKMHCSPYFMPVQTPKGKVAIGEIKVGDEVAVYTEKGLINSLVKRVISYKTPKSDLVRVYLKTSSGSNPGFYIFTKDHQLLDNKGEWIFAENLKNGDILSGDIHNFEVENINANLNDLTQLEIDQNDMVTVYTLEVEHDAHNYIQNGVISKNCSVMAYDVIKEAAAIYKGVDSKSFEEETIVCECARVSLATLREVIKLNNLTTIEQITDYTKAGAFCKSCIKPGGHEQREYYLVDILRDVRAEMDQERLKEAANASVTGDFSKMTLVQKIKAIDSVIDSSVRQFLVADGGNMEVIDIREGERYTDVYIRYLGACSTCSTSTTGTLYAIEVTLKDKLSERIRVLPI